MTDPTDPRETLAAIERTEGRLATRMHWPLYRHAAAGLLQAIFVVAFALPMALMGALVALAVALMVLIMQSDRRRDGMFVGGAVSRAGVPAILISLVLTLGGIAMLVWVGEGMGRWTPAALPIAGVVAIGVTLASLWWEKLCRGELSRKGRV